jgi:mycofactocin precursor
MTPDNQDNQGRSEPSPIQESREEDILAAEEIVVEELAIDGICGVY